MATARKVAEGALHGALVPDRREEFRRIRGRPLRAAGLIRRARPTLHVAVVAVEVVTAVSDRVAALEAARARDGGARLTCGARRGGVARRAGPVGVALRVGLARVPARARGDGAHPADARRAREGADAVLVTGARRAALRAAADAVTAHAAGGALSVLPGTRLRAVAVVDAPGAAPLIIGILALERCVLGRLRACARAGAGRPALGVARAGDRAVGGAAGLATQAVLALWARRVPTADVAVGIGHAASAAEAGKRFCAFVHRRTPRDAAGVDTEARIVGVQRTRPRHTLAVRDALGDGARTVGRDAEAAIGGAVGALLLRIAGGAVGVARAVVATHRCGPRGHRQTDQHQRAQLKRPSHSFHQDQ
mmetsp:Transcript_36762/g.113386  ORF Transcript_36762/g.113386 Transcript_36762/m.113386 type:complete len:365 (+) Transcript_36762:115-1209(+)